MNAKLILSRLEKLRSELIKIPYQKHKARIGSMILDSRGNIISIGYNNYTKTHPLMYTNKYFDGYKIFIHSELDALIKAKLNLSRIYCMIIARIDSKGDLRLAKPCIRCRYQLNLTRLSLVYYTNDLGELVLFNGN